MNFKFERILLLEKCYQTSDAPAKLFCEIKSYSFQAWLYYSKKLSLSSQGQAATPLISQ